MNGGKLLFRSNDVSHTLGMARKAQKTLSGDMEIFPVIFQFRRGIWRIFRDL